jgi:hypothetical protein
MSYRNRTEFIDIWQINILNLIYVDFLVLQATHESGVVIDSECKIVGIIESAIIVQFDVDNYLTCLEDKGRVEI